MKEIEQYGLLKDDEWERLPWIPDPRPPFKLWVSLEDIAPFFLVEHHPYAISVLLKMDEGFKADAFQKFGLKGGSKDWETLAKGMFIEWEEKNSGIDLFHFDSDEDIFCIYSQYIDDLLRFVKTLRAACDNESTMLRYLCLSLFTPEHRHPELDHTEELSDGFSVRFQSFGGEIGKLHLQMSEGVLLDSEGKERFFWRNTDDDGEFVSLIHHANGKRYMIFRFDLYGYGVLDLESLQEIRYLPPQSFTAVREDFKETFIWTDVHYDPESNLLAVSGCFWACPYSVMVLDFSDPMTVQPVEGWLDVRSIIDPNYEIYDDIDFDRWESGILYLKGEGDPRDIRLTVKQLRETLKDLV